MSEDTLEVIENSNIEKVKRIAQRLIIILEDIIGIVSSDREINSENIKAAKERASNAKIYLNDLKENISNLSIRESNNQDNIYNEKLKKYNSECIDDAITAWILGINKESTADSLYAACYKIRELLNKF
jgi:lysyl-tRNA synthetase class I